MKVNIRGDFATIGDGLDAVRNGSALSSQIVDMFMDSDLNIVHLESPVATDKRTAIRKVGPNISTSSIAVAYLKHCHVNLVTLAKLDVARKLSKGMTHVRVDLYNVNGRIYFGELTFFHWSGMTKYEPMEWDYKFGEFIKLPVDLK